MLTKNNTAVNATNAKYSSLIFIIIILLTQNAVAQTDETTQQQQVLEVQTARFDAMIDADIGTLDKLLASDLFYGHTTGKIETKAQFLASIEAKKVDYLSLNAKEVSINFYRRTAIVSGLVDAKLLVGERLVESTIRFLEVYQKFDDTWQLVAWQAVRNTDG